PTVRHFIRLWRLWLPLVPSALAGQTPASVQRAVRSITPEDVRRHIGVLADDSMRGRATPSPELEKVAVYIAGEFKRIGLKPGGDRGTYFQRYSIERVQLVAESSVVSLSGAVTATWRLGTDLQLFGGSPPSGATTGCRRTAAGRSEEHTSELQSRGHLACRLLLGKKNERAT